MLRGGWMIVLEAKTMTGAASNEQLDWLRAYHAAGAVAEVVRPSDAERILEWLA